MLSTLDRESLRDVKQGVAEQLKTAAIKNYRIEMDEPAAALDLAAGLGGGWPIALRFALTGGGGYRRRAQGG